MRTGRNIAILAVPLVIVLVIFQPRSSGGGHGYKTQVETPANSYQVGSVAWAKGGQDPPGTAGSQFFVVTSPASAPGQGVDFLNQQPYQYGIIGAVTDQQSLDVARKIGA